MVASTGDPLLVEDALEAIATRLLPLASVITPNLPEASHLLGRTIEQPEEQNRAAQELSEKYDAACYLKGGHHESHGKHRDVLAISDLHETFEAPHINCEQSHGTGCTLAAALTGGLAKGLSIPEAASLAHQFTHDALKNALTWNVPYSVQKISHLAQTQKFER